MCAPACVGGVGCDAMFRKKFSLLLSISTCICRYVHTFLKNRKGWGEIIFGGGRGQSVALLVILVKT